MAIRKITVKFVQLLESALLPNITDILTMIVLKISLLLCLSTLLPSTQSIKCIQCASALGADTACEAGTTAATACAASFDACMTIYLKLTKGITRSCLIASAYTATLGTLGKSEK